MKIINSAASAVAAMALGACLFAGAAQADTLFSFTGPTTEISSPNSVPTPPFLAGGGAGTLGFTIDGYTTLDGDGNCCTDVFTLNVNGTDILSGSWDLGGGGANVVYFAPATATVAPTSFGGGNGGQVVITTPISLLNGSNTITFSYSGDFQGLDDEGWGLQDITVTGAGFTGSAAPEPASWAMMLVGFFGLGATLRSARRARSLA